MFDTLEVIATAMASYEQRPENSNNQHITGDVIREDLSRAFTDKKIAPQDDPDDCLSVLDYHREEAHKVIQYVQGFAAKPLQGRELTNFENAALDTVNKPQVDTKKFGLIAALPRIYTQGKEKIDWDRKELELSRGSEFISSPGIRISLTLMIEKVMSVRSHRHGVSFLFCCTDGHGNLVKFFRPRSWGSQSGQTIKIQGRVKEHRVNRMGGKETMLNYVKFFDPENKHSDNKKINKVNKQKGR